MKYLLNYEWSTCQDANISQKKIEEYLVIQKNDDIRKGSQCMIDSNYIM